MTTLGQQLWGYPVLCLSLSLSLGTDSLGELSEQEEGFRFIILNLVCPKHNLVSLC